jgi:hypothetical protein
MSRWTVRTSLEPIVQRAGVLVLLGVIFLLGTVPLIVEVRESLHKGSILDDRRWCATTASDCLQEEVGSIDGPFGSRRQPRDEYLFQNSGGEDYFNLDLPGGRDLLPGEGVTVYAIEGDVVAVPVDEFGVVATTRVGARGAFYYLLWINLIVGIGLMGIFRGIEIRRASGAWWETAPDRANAVKGPANLQILLIASLWWFPMHWYGQAWRSWFVCWLSTIALAALWFNRRHIAPAIFRRGVHSR